MGIRLEGVGFTYLPGTPMAREALEGIDLTLREGERVCLMGASGSGKTTLLCLVAGLYPPARGRVLLDGSRVDHSPSGLRRLREVVGILFQSPRRQLFAETVERDVAFGPRNRGLRGPLLAARAREAMKAAGLDPEEYSNRSPFTLSDGEMRLAALAGVLAMEPRYLLLDEPTAGLDPRGRHRLRRLIREMSERGAGVLVATHDWEEAEELADRVEVMAEGRIARSGDVESVAADYAVLRRAGLAPPPVPHLLALLRGKGLGVPERAASPGEAAESIKRAMEGEQP